MSENVSQTHRYKQFVATAYVAEAEMHITATRPSGYHFAGKFDLHFSLKSKMMQGLTIIGSVMFDTPLPNLLFDAVILGSIPDRAPPL